MLESKGNALLSAPRVLAVACTGLYAGIILGDRMGASYARPALTVADFIRFQQIQHLHFKPMLIPITLGAVLGGLIWIWLSRSRWRTASFWLVTTATASMVAVAAMTRIVNFPINDAMMTWRAAAPPSNVRDLWAPWEHVHTVRATLSVIAFILETLALRVE
jgi:uncharacterized membrane protein